MHVCNVYANNANFWLSRSVTYKKTVIYKLEEISCMSQASQTIIDIFYMNTTEVKNYRNRKLTSTV